MKFSDETIQRIRNARTNGAHPARIRRLFPEISKGHFYAIWSGRTRKDTRMDQPWPLSSILKELSQAAEILLKDYSYDGHGHENIRHALDALKEMDL